MIGRWSTRVGTLLLVALLSLPTGASAYSTLYVLGDSLSDTGNLYTATANPPLNAAFPTPLPQPPYFAGRFSNGAVYAEYLWQKLGLSGSLQPSYLGGTDYAVGGARSRYHSFDNSNPAFDPVGGTSAFHAFSLLGQRDALLAAQGGVLDANALYTVWEGSNDVSDAIGLWLSGGTAQAVALIGQAAADFVEVVMNLVGASAQHLLIPNLPNLGLVPEVVALGSGAQGLASQLTLFYNSLVAQNLAAVSADIMRLDTYGVLTDIVSDPAAYGLPATANVDSACFSGFVGVPGSVCGDPQNYVFWDKIHPTAVVHEELGRLAAQAVPEPASVALTVLALLALALARLRVAMPGRRNEVAA